MSLADDLRAALDALRRIGPVVHDADLDVIRYALREALSVVAPESEEVMP